MPKTKSKKIEKKVIILFDAHAIIHRAYHALPEFSSSKGEPTGALYGLSTMLMSIITQFKPYSMVAAFDLPKPTYRHEAYADYKSGRKGLDENLTIQLKRAREVFQAFGIPIYESEGFEADDVIGTAVEQLQKDKTNEVIIASGDMDTMQLIKGKQIKVFTLKKGIKDTIIYDETAVKDRFGFKPTLLTDYKGLRGDPSDNIIGIPGIGDKTATTLIVAFGEIEKMYKKVDALFKKIDIDTDVEKKDLVGTIFEEIKITPRIVNLLRRNKEEAEFSKMLATIRRDAPVEIAVPDISWQESFSVKPVTTLFQDLEFRMLVDRVNQLFGGELIDGMRTGSSDVTQNQETEEDVSQEVLTEAQVMMWVLNSNNTHPSLQDIFHFTKKETLKDAYEVLEKKLVEDGTLHVYEDIEKPVIPVVASMKENGIVVDTDVLKKLSKEYHQELTKLEKEIHALAEDDEFNISSPKQLAEILFTKMELKYKGMRKTSSGSYSTKEEVLQKLVDVHPIAEKILQHRELSKLLGTYIDKLPNEIKEDGRIHPTFLQTGTTTGRMASQDPNIQNIPTKTELGRRIRNAFIAPKGKRLLAIDYSQIELRLAAILSDDEKLLQSFKDGKDIHASVASFVFGVPEDKIDKGMRVKAKTINFGILYGMGVSALQKNLKTDRKEAQKFYNDYFETFTTLRDYLESTKVFVQEHGYTETMFGRRRYFDGINSKLPFIRAQAERMAINAPIQGSQADIIKIAMAKVFTYLKEEKSKDVKMLLQIHDELIFEVPEEQVEEVAKEVTKIMEGVLTEEQTKGVPILVEAQVGQSWGEMKGL